jgi:CRISPR-associated protein Cmr5
MTQSLAQKRAKDALLKIEKLSDYDNYLGYVKALPATIVLSGLGQALAMEKAGEKKDRGHGYLYKHMNDWLLKEWTNSPYREKADILTAITLGSEKHYIAAQVESLAYLEWLKKFAVASLEGLADKTQGAKE